MVRRYLQPVVLALLLAVGAGCGAGDDEEAAPGGEAGGGEAIEISATEFALDPATIELDEAGTYTFRLVNDGGAVHALEIEGNGLEEETEQIGAGESAELTVELAAGQYELYCPVGNHRDQGMEGRVVVGGAAGGGMTTDETTTEDDDTTTEEEDGGYNYR
jgi:plastocyanin